MEEKSQIYKDSRADLIKDKSGAVFVAEQELNGLLNRAELARRYFKKSKGWFSQRMNHTIINGDKEAKFSEKDFDVFVFAYRDIARQLLQFADEIEEASM